MSDSLAMAFIVGAVIWAITAFWAESSSQPRWGKGFLVRSAAGGLVAMAIGVIVAPLTSSSTLLGEGGGATALALMIITESGMIIAGLGSVAVAVVRRKRAST